MSKTWYAEGIKFYKKIVKTIWLENYEDLPAPIIDQQIWP